MGYKGTGRHEIDGKKLADALKKHGLLYEQVSREMGFNAMFISNCIARGTINAPAAKLLKNLYQIDVDSLKPDKAGYKTWAETKEEYDDIKTLLEDIKQELVELTRAQKTNATLAARMLAIWEGGRNEKEKNAEDKNS